MTAMLLPTPPHLQPVPRNVIPLTSRRAITHLPDFAPIFVTVNHEGIHGIPAELSAGRYLFDVMFDGDAWLSPVVFIAIPAGRLDGTLKVEEIAPEPHFAGGMGMTPRATTFGVIDLTVGSWLIYAGATNGVSTMVTVKESAVADSAVPDEDLTITLGVSGIALSGDLEAGEHLALFENTAHQALLAEIYRLPQGVPIDELTLDALVPVIRSAPQSRGVRQWLPLTLEAGTYVAICVRPSLDGKRTIQPEQITVFEVS